MDNKKATVFVCVLQAGISISKMYNRKSTGCDSISIKLLKLPFLTQLRQVYIKSLRVSNHCHFLTENLTALLDAVVTGLVLSPWNFVKRAGSSAWSTAADCSVPFLCALISVHAASQCLGQLGFPSSTHSPPSAADRSLTPLVDSSR